MDSYRVLEVFATSAISIMIPDSPSPAPLNCFVQAAISVYFVKVMKSIEKNMQTLADFAFIS